MGHDGVLWVLDDLFIQCQTSSLSHQKLRIVIVYARQPPTQVVTWQIPGVFLATGVCFTTPRLEFSLICNGMVSSPLTKLWQL